jgi:hypothetical protein
MTTGRINQVTIFGARGSPEAPRAGPCEAGQNCYVGRGTPERSPAGRSRERGYNRFLQAIQLPPLNSPKDGPPYGLIGRQAPSQGTTCAPQEEDTFHQSRPEAATGLGLPPNVFG